VANELTRSLSIRIEELVRENERLGLQLQLALEAPKPEPATVKSTPAVEATPASATRPWWRFWG